MALTSIVNYDDGSNFAFDAAKVEFIGSPVRAKLLIQAADIAKNQPFTADTGFTYDNTKAEFTAGVVQHKDQAPNAIFAADYAVNANPITTEADLVWHRGGLGLGATLNGAPTIVSNRLVCVGTQGAYYVANTKTVETLKCIFRPNYNGSPPAHVNLMSIWNGTNSNDRFNLRHTTTGGLRLYLYNNVSATVAGNITYQNLVAVAGQAYEIEIVIDSVSGLIDVFLDGVRSTFNAGAWTRGTAANRYYIGACPVLENRAEGSFDDFITYDNVQHSANYTPGYTVPPFIYASNNVDLPAFAYAGLPPVGSMLSYISFITTEIGAPRYTIKSGAGSFMYWNGSAWAVSDATYAQASPKADIVANLATLTDVNGETASAVRVHFADGNASGSSVNDLTLTINEHTTYPIDNPSVLQNASVLTDDLETFVETTSVVPGSDDVQYIMQVSGQDKWYNGSTWVNSNGTYAESNTPADVNTNALTLFPTAIGGTLKIKALLHSDAGTTRPELETVTFGYNFYNLQVRPPICNVWGFYRDTRGLPVEGATVTASLVRTNRQYREASDSIIEKKATTTTDADGRFEIELVRSSAYEFGGNYVLTIVKTADELDTSQVETGTKLEFTVPDLDDENITDLLTSVA